MPVTWSSSTPPPRSRARRSADRQQKKKENRRPWWPPVFLFSRPECLLLRRCLLLLRLPVRDRRARNGRTSPVREQLLIVCDHARLDLGLGIALFRPEGRVPLALAGNVHPPPQRSGSRRRRAALAPERASIILELELRLIHVCAWRGDL